MTKILYICCKNKYIMHLFYAPELKNNTHQLSEEESRHCIKVLRLKKGDPIHLTDGRGVLYRARIVDEDLRRCRVEIVDHQREYGKRPFYLHLAIAPPKNMKRFEWFLEKATEIGVDEITPLHCFHSERQHIKIQRMNRVLIAAMKQSLKAYLPLLNEMIPFNEFIQHSPHPANRYIAYLDEQQSVSLSKIYPPGEDALILIGPEGDFSEEEVEQARASGFQPVKLGASRLRTETAGIAACHSVNLLNGC